MINRRTNFLALIAIVLVALALPAVAAAQGNYDPWSRDRDGDYRRDRDNRRRNDNGSYGNDRYGRYDNYDSRTLRDAARNVKDRSHNLQRDVDRLLDHSRIDGTRREDHINADVKEFREAADRFKDRVGDGRNLNRSAREASVLLQSAEEVSQELSRVRADSRTYSDWSEIQQDLRTIANIYGLRYNSYDDGYYRRGNYDPRDNRNRRNNNNDWWRRLPLP